MAEVSGVSSGASITSAAGIETLITQTMALQRTPVTKMKTQKDELLVRRAIYTDVSQKIEALRAAVKSLTDVTSNAFNRLAATSSNAATLGVTGSQTAVPGGYDVTVNRLAQSHQLTSSRQAQSDQMLSLAGTFVIGGGASRAVANESPVADTVGDFGVGASLLTGQTELGSGRYSIEVRNETGWQFRLVDKSGKAVSIARGDGAGGVTDGWQDLAAVAGKTFDSGRGLTISFGSGTYTAGLAGSGAAYADYTAQGASITVEATDSLNHIRDAINAASYAEGNRVTASVVDRTLVLTGNRSGDSAAVQLADTTGTVLSALGLLNRSVTDNADLVTDKGVTAFGTAALAAGKTTLDGGRYQVEIGSGANANKFRLLDASGDAVQISSTSLGTGDLTADWIAAADGVYNTGRGLTFTLHGDGAYDAKTPDEGAASAYFSPAHTLRSARNASLTMNGLTLSRAGNSGLTDVVDGLTFDLKGTGATQVTVSRDNNQIANSVKTLVTKVNDLLNYLKAKTEPAKDEKNSTLEKTVYTRGVLSTDWGLRSLGRGISSDLLGQYTGAATGAVRRLSEVGVSLDSASTGLAFNLSDASALTAALTADTAGVAALFGDVLARVESRVKPYLDGEQAIIKKTQASMDTQSAQMDSRIKSAQERLLSQEKALRQRYQAMQAQMTSLGNDYQLWQAYTNVYNSTTSS